VDRADFSKEKSAIKNANNNYSVHTFEIAIELDTSYVPEVKSMLVLNFTENKLRSKLKNGQFYKWVNSREPGFCNRYTCYDNEELFEYGIMDVHIVEVMRKEYENVVTVWRSFLRFRINPRPLLGHSDNRYICITPAEELLLVIPKLKDILSEYGINAYMFECLYVRRIDYCCNIDLGSQKSAERYLKLLRKGGFYRALNFKPKILDKKQHRYVYPRNEVRYINGSWNACRREELSIYLKYSQMSESDKNYDTAELETAKGQIRIELRVELPKLRYLQKKYECYEPGRLMGSSGEIGENLLNVYLYGLYGSGKFVSVSEALKRIDTSSHRPAIKKRLAGIVLTTRHADFMEACEPYSTSEKSEIRKYFNNLGISPITLPDSWEEKEFANPVNYIKTNNVNKR